MKKHKILIISAALLLAGAGTTVAAGPGEYTNIGQNTEQATVGSSLSQLYEFKVNVGGEEIPLPISYTDLKAKGWILKNIGPLESTEPYTEQYMVKSFGIARPTFYKGNVTISASVLNSTPAACRIMDLDITTLTFSQYDITDSELKVVFPGDIVLGQSTEADVMAAYGQPTSDSVGSRYKTLEYQKEWARKIRFSHSNDESQTIRIVTVQNQQEQHQKGMEYLNNIPRSPEVQAYTAPSALGDNIRKGTFEFGGDIYQFPAPLTAFLDNGWEIASRELPTFYLEPGNEAGVALVRNGIQESVTVKNESTERAPLQNCFTFYMWGPMSLPRGIRIGSSRGYALKTLSDLDYTVDEDSYCYAVKSEDGKYEIQVRIDDYENKVVQVLICPPNLFPR